MVDSPLTRRRLGTRQAFSSLQLWAKNSDPGEALGEEGGGNRRTDPFCQRRSKRRERINHSFCAFLSRCLLYPVTYGLHRKNILTSTTGGTPQNGQTAGRPSSLGPSSISPVNDDTCAGPALRQKKTCSRTVAFEMSGNSHARLLWQSRWKVRSAIQPPPQNPPSHLQIRRFRFVRTLRKTTVAHKEEADSGRLIVSRPIPGATLRCICAQKHTNVLPRRESRRQRTA